MNELRASPPSIGTLVYLCIALCATRASATPDSLHVDLPRPIPVASPLLEELEVLALRGELTLPSLYTGPVDAYDAARAMLAGGGTGIATTRVERGLDLELHDLGARDVRPTQPWISLESPDARLFVTPFARYNAEASPDRGFVNTDSTRAGLRFALELLPGLQFFQELYVANVEGGTRFADPLFADTDIILTQERTFIALRTRYADVFFGRDRQAWAPGRNGSLLLSRTARPFTHLRVASSFLGDRFHASIVNGVLSKEEERYIAYHRFEWLVSPKLRVALAEGARYQSTGIEPLYLIGIIPYPLVQRLLEQDATSSTTEDAVRNNVIWSFDASYRPRPGIHVYGELLIDDFGAEDNDSPARIGYQLGTHHLNTIAGRELRTRFEWTRVWRFVYSVFYGADFVHQGDPLGYPLGPDSRHLMLATSLQLNREWQAGARIARQDRGENRIGDFWDPDDPSMADVDPSEFGGVVETQWQLSGTCGFTPGRHIQAFAELGWARAENAAHVAGVQEDGLFGKVSVAFQR